MIKHPPSRRSTPEEVAFHEAGHVVVGHLLGLGLVDADVVPDSEGGYGHTNFRAPDWFRRQQPMDDRHRRYVEAVVTTFVAGSATEARLAGFVNAEAGSFDLDAIAREWVLYLVPASQAEERLQELGAAAATLIGDPANWAAIQRVAAALLKQKRLSASEALALAATKPATLRTPGAKSA